MLNILYVVANDILLFQSAKEANLTTQSRLKCAAGLADLATRKYKSAAKYFLQTSFDHCDFPEVSMRYMLYLLLKLTGFW